MPLYFLLRNWQSSFFFHPSQTRLIFGFLNTKRKSIWKCVAMTHLGVNGTLVLFFTILALEYNLKEATAAMARGIQYKSFYIIMKCTQVCHYQEKTSALRSPASMGHGYGTSLWLSRPSWLFCVACKEEDLSKVFLHILWTKEVLQERGNRGPRMTRVRKNSTFRRSSKS